jgi:nucleotide-binding universal stress UspA family protein
MKRNANVVVGIDFSEFGDLALDAALGIAADGGSQLHAVYVLPPFGLPVGAEFTGPSGVQLIEVRLEETSERLRRHVEARASRLARERPLGIGRLVTHVRVARAAEGITAVAAEVDADLVVVGTHGRRGVPRLLLGSVAEMTTRLCQCPVLVVRPKQHELSRERVPKIEPPCPRCIETRIASHGQQMWCEQHSEHHGMPHHYHQGDRLETEVSMPLVFPMR